MRKTPMVLVMIAFCASVSMARQADLQAVAEFQRAADRYAFQHRQVERRLGGEPDTAAISRGMRVTRTEAREGALFTPLVGAAFRERVARAVRTGKCESPSRGADFQVPRVHQPAGSARQLSACLSAVLPKLPPELEYRVAGVALLLVDVHADLVVDVLHAAFPGQ